MLKETFSHHLALFVVETKKASGEPVANVGPLENEFRGGDILRSVVFYKQHYSTEKMAGDSSTRL